jgi:DNA replication initiation complex subunit (GINS family)
LGLVSEGGNIVIPGKMVDLVDSCQLIANDVVESGLIEGLNQPDLIILRFLQPVPAFVGTDSKTHGPFSPDDVATIPGLNAKGLIFKELAVQIIPESMEAKT